MSRWSPLTSDSSISVTTTETNLIAPFQLPPTIDDILIETIESNNNAATVRVYGSIGTSSSTETVPSFVLGGNNWGQINTDADGALSANSTLLFFSPRKPRYMTVRAVTSSGTSSIYCIVTWRG